MAGAALISCSLHSLPLEPRSPAAPQHLTAYWLPAGQALPQGPRTAAAALRPVGGGVALSGRLVAAGSGRGLLAGCW